MSNGKANKKTISKTKISFQHLGFLSCCIWIYLVSLGHQVLEESYAYVIVDDFSRYTWVLFLSQKNKVFYEFSNFCNKVQNEKGFIITCITSDDGREFENIDFDEYCNKYGINHNFSAPKTPQQKGVVERKNRTLQEMARIMLNENNLPKYF